MMIIDRIRRLAAPPALASQEDTRLGNLLNSALLVLLAAGLITPLLVAGTSLLDDYPSPLQLAAIGASLLLAATMLGLLALLKRGFLDLVGVVLTLLLLVTMSGVLLLGGLRSISAPAFVVVIIFASLLHRRKWFIGVVTATAVAATFLIFLAEATGWLAPPPVTLQLADWLVFASLLVVAGLLLRYAAGHLEGALERVRAAEEALAAAGQELEALNMTLEERVAERTRALTLSARVGRRLSTILDQNQLVAEVVDQIQAAFDYYHVHIYLLDEAAGLLGMVGGTGEPGQQMLANGHAIPLGRGMVGQAAATGRQLLAPDVTQQANWLANPLLPHTKSELAVPIAIGGRLLGVLDVQEDAVGALADDDAELLQMIANQVAVALQNAELYARAQRQAAQQARLNAIAQKIQATTTVEAALKTAVRELGRALDGAPAGVWLAGADGETVDQPAATPAMPAEADR